MIGIIRVENGVNVTSYGIVGRGRTSLVDLAKPGECCRFHADLWQKNDDLVQKHNEHEASWFDEEEPMFFIADINNVSCSITVGSYLFTI